MSGAGARLLRALDFLESGANGLDDGEDGEEEEELRAKLSERNSSEDQGSGNEIKEILDEDEENEHVSGGRDRSNEGKQRDHPTGYF